MGSVYFGNANKQTWIKAPKTGMGASTVNWSNQGVLLSGKAFVKRSGASHRRFEMNWSGSKNDSTLENSLQVIKNFADGLYGEGPFFWVDPFAADQNLFSPGWASPFLGVSSDWEQIFSDSAAVTQSTVTTASISALVGNNTYDYPANTAKFDFTSATTFSGNIFTFYIPDGYTLWLGAHGHRTTNCAIYAKPYNAAGTAGTPTDMTMLGVNVGTRFNTSFNSTAAKKVEVYVSKTSSGTATMHLTGLIAQLVPTGAGASTGNFIAGSGTTGIEFSNIPTIEYYSANINNGQIGMSATFVEV